MSQYASPAVLSWTTDPAERFQLCFVDDLNYSNRKPNAMPVPPARPGSAPPMNIPSSSVTHSTSMPYEPSAHLRFLVTSPRTTRAEVEHRLHLLKMSLHRLKGEQHKQALGDIAFLQCVLEKSGSTFIGTQTTVTETFSSASPPKSPRFKAFILNHSHKHGKEKGSGLKTPPRGVSPVPSGTSTPEGVPRDERASCCVEAGAAA